MNYVDLFSGIGGFAVGAYRAGLRFRRHYFSEIDPWLSALYQKRFPESIPLGDIREIKPDSIEGPVIFSGGFPCQDISGAGKGAGLEGERSGLWFEYARLISQVRPRYAIMENVGALVQRGLDRVLGSLAEIGYDAEWCDLRASDLGAPHKRERIWIVAYPQRERTGSRPCGGDRALEDAPSEDTFEEGSFGHGCWERWKTESRVGRVADGIPDRIHRLKGLGNAVVPQIAELIFRQLPGLKGEYS